MSRCLGGATPFIETCMTRVPKLLSVVHKVMDGTPCLADRNLLKDIVVVVTEELRGVSITAYCPQGSWQALGKRCITKKSNNDGSAATA